MTHSLSLSFSANSSPVASSIFRLPPSLPAPGDMDGGGKMDARSMSMSMSSVGKVVYESVHRGTATTSSGVAPEAALQQQQAHPEALANQRNNLVYCPSPYATTRVSLFFPATGSSSTRSVDGQVLASEQNCYDMPMIKPVRVSVC